MNFEELKLRFDSQIADLRDAQDANQKLLQDQLNKLMGMVTAQQAPAPAPIPLPIPMPSGPTVPNQNHSAGLKAPLPDSFDGSRSNGRFFWDSCVGYMNLYPAQFPDDERRIRWIVLSMKEGRAATFASRLMRRWERGEPVGSFADFALEFEEEFFPANEALEARLRLETESYYQGRKSVDEYNDEFKELIDLAGYTDKLDMVMKYRRGLDAAIQDKVAGMDYPPADRDLAGWYSHAS
jgi:hypothetical protein